MVFLHICHGSNVAKLGYA